MQQLVSQGGLEPLTALAQVADQAGQGLCHVRSERSVLTLACALSH